MKRVILLSLSILLISLAYSFAEVPCKINYQGRLIKDNVPVDGTKTMVFSIYAVVTGGSPIWTSGDVSVEVHNGLFRYVIGSGGGDLSSIFQTAGETLYLEVIIGGETLTPREELSAYPYAINSHLLEGATKEYFLNTSGDTQTKQGNLNIMGNLGIGTTGPGSTLSVVKSIPVNTFTPIVRIDNTTGESGSDHIYTVLQLRSVANNDRQNTALIDDLVSGVGGFGILSGRVLKFETGYDYLGSRTTAMTINLNGNVGIGTTSPGAKLEVAGNLKATGGIEPDWDSGWFNVVANTSYTKNHNLGTKYYTVLILYRKDASATYYNIASHYEQPYRSTWNGKKTGACVLEQGDNYILIRTGSWVNGIGFTDLNSKYYQTSGQYCILLWKF